MSMYSSYTDLNNVIKENVVVGHKADDRITNQKIRFFNNENEYWGTFEGVVNTKNAYIGGGIISNVSLSACRIQTEAGEDLNMSYVAEDIQDLQADVREMISKFDSVSAKNDMSMKYCGKISVDSYIETFKELFSIADNQLGISDEIVKNQIFTVDCSNLTAEHGLSVEGFSIRGSDFIILKNDKRPLDVTSADVTVLKQVDARDFQEFSDKVDEISGRLSALEGRSAVVSMSQYQQISAEAASDGVMYFVYEDEPSDEPGVDPTPSGGNENPACQDCDGSCGDDCACPQ